MFWFKQCSRCSGDLHYTRDWYGPFITCLQCGTSKDVVALPADINELSFEPISPPAVPKSESGKRRRLSNGGRHRAHSGVF